MHNRKINFKIIRKPELLDKIGFSRTTLAVRIKDQLFVPPISLGARAVGFLESETNAVISAMVAGKSKDEIRSLVTSLVEQRISMGG